MFQNFTNDVDMNNPIMSPLEKVKNRVPIQNMLTFYHTTLSIEKSTKIEYTM